MTKTKNKNIRTLIKEGEGPKVEFKREIHLSGAAGQVEFSKDVSSLANTLNQFGNEGYLLVGIEDNREVAGLSAPLDDQKIQRVLDKYLQPRLQVSVSHVSLDGRLIGVIRIPKSYRKPHKIKKSYHDKKSIQADTVFTRHLSQVVIASPEEIVALDQEASREKKRRYLYGLFLGVFFILMLCALSWWSLQNPIIQKQVYAVLPWERIPFVPDKVDTNALPLSRNAVDESLLGIGRLHAYELEYTLTGLQENAISFNLKLQMTVSNYDYNLLKTGDIPSGGKEEIYGIGEKKCNYMSGVNPEQWLCTSRKNLWAPDTLADYPAEVAKMEGVQDVVSLLSGYYPDNEQDIQMYKIYRPGHVGEQKCDIYRSHFQISPNGQFPIMISLGTRLIDLAPNSDINVREEGCVIDGMFLKYVGVLDFKDKEGISSEIQVFYNATVLEEPPTIQLPPNILIIGEN